MKNLPNRREREEIDNLAKQLKDLEENLKIKDQRNKLTIERLKKQLTEAKEKNQELVEERNTVFLAVKGFQYKEEHKQEAPNYGGDTVEEAEGEQEDDTNEDDRYSNTKVKDSNPAQNKFKNVNFYHPVDERDDSQNIVDLNNMSHSPQFGSRKADFIDNNFKNTAVQHNNYTKPSFGQPDSEEEQEEYQSEEQNEQEDEEEKSDKPEDEELDDLNPSQYDMQFLPRYHNNDDANKRVVQENISNDGKIVRWYANSKKEVIFRKGVRKEIFPDGYTIVYFKNKDIKQTYPDGKVVYYFDEARTTQTTELDGVHIYKFYNGQIEKHFPDGSKEIR